MKRRLFIKQAGLGIGGLILGASLILGAKKESRKKANSIMAVFVGDEKVWEGECYPTDLTWEMPTRVVVTPKYFTGWADVSNELLK